MPVDSTWHSSQLHIVLGSTQAWSDTDCIISNLGHSIRLILADIDPPNETFSLAPYAFNSSFLPNMWEVDPETKNKVIENEASVSTPLTLWAPTAGCRDFIALHSQHLGG